MKLTEKALMYATKAHSGQVRKYTGEPYIFHPIEVALMAVKLGMSDNAICAALLHDVVEDCDISVEYIYNEFGINIARYVKGLTEVSKPTDGNRAMRKSRDRDWYASQSPDVQTIKVLDMISNTVSIKEHDPEFWKVYRNEKLELLNALTLADKRAVEMAYKAIGELQ